jgi:hypothetical protein
MATSRCCDVASLLVDVDGNGTSHRTRTMQLEHLAAGFEDPNFGQEVFGRRH